MNSIEIILLYIFGVFCILTTVWIMGMIYICFPGFGKYDEKLMLGSRKGFKQWKSEHPEAQTMQKFKQASQATIDVFGAEIGFHTLPSIFAPMSEESVLKLKKSIDKLNDR